MLTLRIPIGMIKRRLGLSLLEIVIAMGIMAAIIIPVFTIFSASSSSMDVTDSDFKAHNCAIEVMEQVISLPFKYLKEGIYSESKVKDKLNFGNSRIPFIISSDLATKVTIEDVKEDNRIAFKKVDVEVTYLASKSATNNKTFKISTLVANETN